MESDEGLRDQQRAADRAAAAPYTEYPPEPWWTAPGAGILGVLAVLSVWLHGRSDAPDVVAILLLGLVVATAMGYSWWQRRRRHTWPSGTAPREVNRVLWSFMAGAVIISIGMFLLGDLAPLWLGLPAAFIGVTAAMYWYITAYGRAAEAVRKRLT